MAVGDESRYIRNAVIASGLLAAQPVQVMNVKSAHVLAPPLLAILAPVLVSLAHNFSDHVAPLRKVISFHCLSMG